MHLHTLLDGTVSSTNVRLSSYVVIGSNEECRLMKAIHDIFHEATPAVHITTKGKRH